MLAGHIGVGLAVGRLERRSNLGWWITAAVLLDLILWGLVLLGWERVSIPEDYGTRRLLVFHFPCSHSLLAGLAWSAVAAAAAWRWLVPGTGPRWRLAALLAAAVFSHWLLDALVHQHLPLADDRVTVGLGLWQHQTVAILLESVIAVAGLACLLSDRSLPLGRRLSLTALCLIVLGLTLFGMTKAPAPPSGEAVASSSLGLLLLTCGLAFWLGRRSP